MGYFRTQVGSDVPPPGTFNEAKRSNINVDGFNTFSYFFIDHMKQADGSFNPAGNGFYVIANPSFTTCTDANGWPNNAAANTLGWGGGPRIPSSKNFPGPYVLTWIGDGTVTIYGGNTVWSANLTSSAGDTTNTYTGSAGTYTNKPGQNARVILNVSNPVMQLINVNVLSTGPSNFAKNVQLYRLEDEGDLLAGNVFRRSFKQLYIDYNGHNVRVLNWDGVNDSVVTRFEHRGLPSYANWSPDISGAGQPRYGKCTAASNGAYTLPAVTGTPASMQHGEMVTCRIDTALARSASGAIGVTAITRNNTATNTVTAPSHGFANGDTIQIQMQSQTPGDIPSGMTQLHDVPCVISNVTTNTFDIAVNTSTYTPFAVGNAYQYVTLQVGTGSDRVAYPIVWNDAVSKIGRFPYNWGPGYPTAYRTFVFNKLIKSSSTVTGAWCCCISGVQGVSNGSPIEVLVKLCNELQAMSPAKPIHFWYNLPAWGLISTDASFDSTYTAASNYAVNAVDVIINPSSTVRAAGWSALDSRAILHIEHANETWNFAPGYAMARVSWQKWPATGMHLGKYSTVRAVQTFKDIKAAFPSHPRIKYVMGMFTTLGPGDGRNDLRLTGDSDMFTELGSSNPMLTYYDYICIAGYFSNNDQTPANSLATCVSAFVAAGANDATIESVCATYAAGLAQQAIGGSQAIDSYVTLLHSYATAAAAQGKRVIGYEGGVETANTTTHSITFATFASSTSVTSVGGSGPITVPVGYYVFGDGIPKYTKVTASGSGTLTLSAAATISGISALTYMNQQDAFSMYFKQSQAWSDTYITWFNAWNSISNADAPAEFSFFEGGGDRWCHVLDDQYSGGVEFAAADKAWLALKARNNS